CTGSETAVRSGDRSCDPYSNGRSEPVSCVSETARGEADRLLRVTRLSVLVWTTFPVISRNGADSGSSE
ncbi:MAG: hypothetical protein Q4C47_04450, partial [Planctomycetia bacterium]|nr:hypothetical protein [Planctomycetia bacterium]